MRKPKATVQSLRKELKELQAKFDKFRTDVRAYALAVNVNGRDLMTIEPANNKGMVNGLTIPELIMLVNLNDGTGEVIQLRTVNNKHDLVVTARKRVPTPWELM